MSQEENTLKARVVYLENSLRALHVGLGRIIEELSIEKHLIEQTLGLRETGGEPGKPKSKRCKNKTVEETLPSLFPLTSKAT